MKAGSPEALGKSKLQILTRTCVVPFEPMKSTKILTVIQLIVQMLMLMT